ncbi:MAG TPA: 4'-phosphopantetheinyl transferase superfamily protein [Pirellulales bacterium]|jgi:4'-phosphopantetheinyl transferase|nr:4'-phosphopantetheinyl transferase superfamily protein [Pirellulales bacterium]
MPGSLLPLGDDEVHLWHLDPDTVGDPSILDSYRRLLSADERERHGRFRVAGVRHQFLVTRGMVRTILSSYGPLEPAAWQFQCNEFGRPELANFPGPRLLRFNLSHSHGSIVCGVVWNRDLGVDVEYIDRRSGGPHLARRFFAPREVDDLLALPLAEQRSAFFDYWTLKESYIKARGKGLAIPLDKFGFVLRRGQPIRIECHAELCDDPGRWQFMQVDLSPRHRLALAVERVSGADCCLVMRPFSP